MKFVLILYKNFYCVNLSLEQLKYLVYSINCTKIPQNTLFHVNSRIIFRISELHVSSTILYFRFNWPIGRLMRFDGGVKPMPRLEQPGCFAKNKTMTRRQRIVSDLTKTKNIRNRLRVTNWPIESNSLFYLVRCRIKRTGTPATPSTLGPEQELSRSPGTAVERRIGANTLLT